jgi:hypothetical protein
MWTDVSEEHITSIFVTVIQPSKKPACNRWLGTWVRARLNFDPEEGDDMFLRNVYPYTDYMALYPRRWHHP